LQKVNLPIEQALELARGTCDVPNCPYGDYCPRYWRRVFVLYFGSEPTGDADKRWDGLFKIGFPTRQYLKAERAQKKAAS